MSDALTEKPISSDLIYDGRVVHLYVDTVQLPNGKTAKREVIRHVGAVALVPIDSSGNIVMVRQYRHPLGRILLEIPAGTLNPNEDPDLCAVRELQEETGYKPGHLEKLGGIYLAPGYSSEFIHLYIATELSESRLNMDEDEFIEIVRLPLQEALKRIGTGEIADSKTISALLLAKDRLG
jgi:ADP-ribose pyrophosphatase